MKASGHVVINFDLVMHGGQNSDELTLSRVGARGLLLSVGYVYLNSI